MPAKNAVGLWMSSFQQGLLANRPTIYPGDANLAIYFATDTRQTFICEVPTAADGVTPNFSGTAVWNAMANSAPVLVPDAAAYTVLAADSGRLHILPNFTSNCTITLPAPALGLNYQFIGLAGAADAQSWIFLLASGLLKGGVLGMDTDAGAGSDELVPAYANGTTHIRLTVATPDAGCDITFIGDGTNMIVAGQVASAAAPVFAT